MVGPALTDQLATLYGALQLTPSAYAIIALVLMFLSVRAAIKATS